MVLPLSNNIIKEIKEKIKEAKSRAEFISKYPEHYKQLKRRGLAGKLLGHFPMKKREFWSLESARAEAKKYKTRNDFYINSPSAYGWLSKHKHLEEVLGTITPKQNHVFDKNFVSWL